MKIYGLSGKSGTGKSYNAAKLADQLGAEAIIDDGLLISGGTILAGISAKRQETHVGAIKTAIFTDSSHALSVSEAIRNNGIESVLILGTSDRMIYMICERLGLHEPDKIVHIEDITNWVQRNIAKLSREETGTHVIPAPTLQVKKQFSGYFLDAKKGFRKEADKKRKGIERTIVRPTYSYLGSFNISEKVISDIVKISASRIDGISSVLWTSSDKSDDGMYIRIILQFRYGSSVRKAALKLQSMVYDTVAEMTAFNILGVEVEARGYGNPL